ncbi:MAG: hypothetical protein ACTSVI_04515 [Promethearchaeota archaeon]
MFQPAEYFPKASIIVIIQAQVIVHFLIEALIELKPDEILA